jgi:hypothetical protein
MINYLEFEIRNTIYDILFLKITLYFFLSLSFGD